VETVIGQLSEQFNIEKVRDRDLCHLTSRMARKLLAHTVGVLINHILGRNLLQFDGLVAASCTWRNYGIQYLTSAKSLQESAIICF
jgi:hypothetical protein